MSHARSFARRSVRKDALTQVEGEKDKPIPSVERSQDSKRVLSISDFIAIAGFALSIASLVVSTDANRRANLTSYRTIIYQARVNSFNSYPRAAMKFEAAIRKAMLVIPFRVEDKGVVEGMSVPQWKYTAAKVNFMIDAYEEFLQEIGTSGYNWPLEVRQKLAASYSAARNAVSCFTLIGSRPEQSDPVWWKDISEQVVENCAQIQDRSTGGPAMIFFSAWRDARDEMLKNLEQVADHPEKIVHQSTPRASEARDIW